MGRLCGRRPVAAAIGGPGRGARGIVLFFVVAADYDSMLEIAEGDGERAGRFRAAVKREVDCEAIFAGVVVGQRGRKQSTRPTFASADGDVKLRTEGENH